MKKLLLKISTLFLAITLVLAGFCACSGSEPKKLDTPAVEIGRDGAAVWSEVDGALYYMYVIDSGAEQLTTERRAQLELGQSICVKAVSGKEGYQDSDYSAPKTYSGEAPEPHDHTDLDSDGLCDRCGDSVMAELSFYAVNDLHGKFKDSGSQPGVDEFTTYVKNLYADPVREEVLLSSGDMWQGTVESSSTKGRLMTEWMNEAQFVSMTLGNHEYDWGAAALEANSAIAEFPFLAINVTVNGTRPSYCQPSVVVELEQSGVKVGVIGAIGDCLSSISGEFQDGLSFATGDSLTALVRNEARRLRTEEGCDFIVYSLHDGGSGYSSSVTEVTDSKLTVQDGNSSYEYYNTALSDRTAAGYVDLVFEGHTHQRYIVKDKFGVYHLQGGGENEGVSSAQVSFNTVTGEYTVSPAILSVATYASSSLADDPIAAELYGKYFPDPAEDPYTKVLGTNGATRRSSEICDTTAQLYFERGQAEWGAEYTIVAGGGFLKARSPYNIYSGNVTYSQLYSVMPFDNAIVLCKVNGRYLKSIFLSNTSESYHVYHPSITASQVQDSAEYYVVTDTYTSFYRYNRSHLQEVARLTDVFARDLLADHIRQGGWA